MKALERAARAACRAAGHDPDGPTMDIYVPGDPDAGSPWASYRNIARAVLMAVSDITTSDLGRIAAEAANDAASGYEEYATEYMMWAAHKAVIQAILNDGEGE